VGAWVVVGAADPEAEAALLALELSAQLGVDVEVVKVERTEALASLSQANTEPVVLVANELNVPSLDEQRGRLRRMRGATLVVPMDVLDRLFTEARTSPVGSGRGSMSWRRIASLMRRHVRSDWQRCVRITR